MGNTYNIAKCPKCDRAFEADTVMVHRAVNFAKAVEMLQLGVPITVVREHFCEYCGELIEVPGVTECDCPAAIVSRTEPAPH